MIVSNPADNQITPTFIEGSLTLIAVALAFAAPRLGSNLFTHVERAFAPLAPRCGLAVTVVGLTAFLLRLAILPFCPIPLPFVPDDFSFLLAADTFLHGRLTNPTPVMWIHFETIHITMQPTYMSMYFPAQGLLLAVGKLLFGNPWYAVLLSSALMCAAICWMLQAWLPPTWALFGGMIAVLHLGLFSYWVNSYHAVGTIGAIGGSLILGALPRLIRTAQMRYGVILALGIAILVLSRPYEGLLLCLPVAVVLGRWIVKDKKRPPMSILMRRAALPSFLIVAAIGWLGYYDYRVNGSPTTLPYTINRTQYAMAPYFVWQSPRPEPAYRHEEFRRFYYEAEIEFFAKVHSLRGFLPQTILKASWSVVFYSGLALLPPLAMLRRVLLDRRTRFLVWCAGILAVGMAIQIFSIPHYTAAFTSAFYAIGLQAMRHLRVWTAEGKPVGLTLVRMLVSILIIMSGLRLYAGPLHLGLAEWPAVRWNFIWYGPDHFGTDRANVENSLEHTPGKQLAIVRYTPMHNPIEEWVYNASDIDSSKVIWAQEMDTSNNDELIRYYKDRHVWLVQPDSKSAMLSPYPISGKLPPVSH